MHNWEVGIVVQMLKSTRTVYIGPLLLPKSRHAYRMLWLSVDFRAIIFIQTQNQTQTQKGPFSRLVIAVSGGGGVLISDRVVFGVFQAMSVGRIFQHVNIAWSLN